MSAAKNDESAGGGADAAIARAVAELAAIPGRIGKVAPFVLARDAMRSVPQVRSLGADLVSIGDGSAVVRLDWREELVGNPDSGAVMGGVITTLIDSVMGTAVGVAVRGGSGVSTLDLRVDHLRASTRGETLFVRAVCRRRTRHIAFVSAEAYHEGPPETVLATAAATFALAPPQGSTAGKHR